MVTVPCSTQMFSEPARRAGVPRWGIKEVRLGIEHGFYLRWLYPKARFLVLYRNPLDAYRSYSQYGRSWYDTFPDKPVFTPTAFGPHWRRLMEGFLRDAGKLDALLVRYEDLVGERPPLDEIDAHLGITDGPRRVGRQGGRLGARRQESAGEPPGEVAAQACRVARGGRSWVTRGSAIVASRPSSSPCRLADDHGRQYHCLHL